VIIPAHNAEATIERAVASALAQTVPVLEVIVGDDGSTDRTADVAEASGAKVLRLPRGNGSIARNAAAREAAGEVLFFLDADDWWTVQKVEMHLAVWEERTPALVLDRATPVRTDGRRVYWSGGLNRDGRVGWRGMISHRAWPSGSGFSVLASHYWSVGGFNEALRKFQDVDFWVRCIATLGDGWTMRASYTLYQQAEGTVSRVPFDPRENLETMLAGWTFATEADKEKMRRLAYLLHSGHVRFPEALGWMRRAGWPVGNRYFWKCVLTSLRVWARGARG
jgi:hypothetical protein